MPTNVVMPQMGESIAEGTIVRWIKKIGDEVDRDEPLFEISTDKVDAEIPSPAAGVLTVDQGRKKARPSRSTASSRSIGGERARSRPPRRSRDARSRRRLHAGAAPSERPAARSGAAGEPDSPRDARSSADEPSADDLRRQKSSPLVRRIAQEHHIDIRPIHGTGIAGRVTKQDILDYIERRAAVTPAAARSAKRPARA